VNNLPKVVTRCLEQDLNLNVLLVAPPRLPEHNRAWLLGVYVVAPRPLLSLYGIIYVTYVT